MLSLFSKQLHNWMNKMFLCHLSIIKKLKNQPIEIKLIIYLPLDYPCLPYAKVLQADLHPSVNVSFTKHWSQFLHCFSMKMAVKVPIVKRADISKRENSLQYTGKTKNYRLKCPKIVTIVLNLVTLLCYCLQFKYFRLYDFTL